MGVIVGAGVTCGAISDFVTTGSCASAAACGFVLVVKSALNEVRNWLARLATLFGAAIGSG